MRKEWNLIVKKFIIIAKNPKFKYEYSKIGLFDKKTITESELKNPLIQALLQKGLISVFDYHETKILNNKKIKKLVEEVTKEKSVEEVNKEENHTDFISEEA